MGGRHNDTGADAKICSHFICIYEKKSLAAPDPIVAAVCIYI